MIADIATVFHWPPSACWPMPVAELVGWHVRAVERFKAAHAAKSQY
ncbi:GpE family phage tail protein [Gibbsiella dentisursi]